MPLTGIVPSAGTRSDLVKGHGSPYTAPISAQVRVPSIIPEHAMRLHTALTLRQFGTQTAACTSPFHTHRPLPFDATP
jgi:hypothetical protein